MIGVVAHRRRKCQALLRGQEISDRGLLIGAYLQNQATARFKKTYRLIDQRGNDPEAIEAAIQSAMRLEITNPSLKLRDDLRGDIGRIRDDHVERAFVRDRIE